MEVEHHERKSPFPLTTEALQPSKSTDEIAVHYDETQSLARSVQADRDITCYTATNVTKGHIYQVELLEDDQGRPHGWCDCRAAVVCKHIRRALQEYRQAYPDFGTPTLPKRPTLREAAEAALKMLIGSDREHALVFEHPHYTICDMLRESLGHPPQDRSDW